MYENASRLQKPKKLRKDIKNSMKNIRAQYKSALKNSDESIINEWLCDNYYIFEREGISIIKDLKRCETLPMSSNGLPRIYNICETICIDGKLPVQDELEAKLTKDKPSVIELEMLQVMLKAVFLNIVSLSCVEKLEDPLKMLSSAVGSLRSISDIDFETLTENVSEVEKILKQDPTGVYGAMDDASRAHYRHQVALEAKRENVEEFIFANRILVKARSDNQHIGKYLKLNPNNKKRGYISIWIEVLLPLVVAVVIGILVKAWYIPFLLYLPLFQIFIPIIQLFSMCKVRPTFFPRIKTGNKVPEDASTLVVVSLILPSAKKVNELEKRLLALKRSNGQGNIKFCILADFKSSKSPVNLDDKENLKAAQDVIDKLNKKYGGFILAVRPRIFSNTQNEYTGWERKRGAITQLIRAIKGENTEFEVLQGDLEGFSDIRYIMALDADTNLPLDTVSELVSVAIHPLNQPVINDAKGRVTSGYGIFTPKIETEIHSSYNTGFSRVMASVGGITAYNNTCSDKYQDLFDEAIFAGKGLLDVDVFHKLLNGKFPPELVLSHDILEGGYMRVGFVSGAQITDSFPSHQGAFLDRMHRWVRGDWQNLRFVFQKKAKNPLNIISRIKLLDNLRRSLTPVALIISLLLSLLMPLPISRLVAFIVLLSSCFGEFFAGIYSLIVGGITMCSRLYYSNAMPSAVKSFSGAAVSVAMLAQTAWVCFDAIIKALWRQFISHKNLLQWVTAAESEKSQKIWGFIKRYLPSLIIAAVVLVFGTPVHILLGLAFVINIPFALLSAKTRKPTVTSISDVDREKLKFYASGMWKYYEELCSEENNYLPPDNFQETPVHRIAHRTSPTNIGFMLLCTLTARDFGFIDTKTLCERLDKSITSIEKLEKWNGNLLNWYNTKTLETLCPKYVSTVDSGNFLCSIVALRQGLSQMNDKHPMLPSLIERLNNLIDNSDLSPLYNKKRKLFHIGFNLNDQTYSNSYYDLLMSEARMTSFYAIASRQAPKEHWGALGRTLATESRYAGPVSWTGTMFEYYMPSIVLPVYENTMGYEALRFCVFCQKRRVKGKKIPWGISESGFYAFDSQLNYQYKAHGVQKLGLKRGLNSDLVISPYSTFLVLPFEPKSAMKNIYELEEMQMTGRCGFYEAADFTAERLDGQDYAVVRSYMAHHVGMSMLCIANLLLDNIVQKRFMSDEKMAGAVSLLQEKIPAEAPLFRDVELHEVPQRPEREEPQTREFSDLNPLDPNVRLFTNGEWSMAICDNGSSISRYRGADITRYSNDLLKNPLGIFAFVKQGKKTLPITKALDYNNKAYFKASYSNTDMTLSSKGLELECSMTAMVHPRLPCEQRRITIKNTSKKEFKGELIIYFEPSLITHHEEIQHPAFSKLFILSEFDDKNKILVFNRQPRKGEEPLSLATGFLEDFEYDYGMSREEVLHSPKGIFSLLSSSITLQKESTPDACAVFKIPIDIQPKQQVTRTLILCAASTQPEAMDRALKAREDGKLLPHNASPTPFKDDRIDGIIADTVMPYILFTQKDIKETIAARKKNVKNKRAVWEFGVSGDNPIIFAQIENEDDLSKVSPYVRIVGKLRKSGIITDLVIAYKENDEYNSPILESIRQMLIKESAQEVAGIFPIDLNKFDELSVVSLKATAVYIAPMTDRITLPPPKYVPFEQKSTSPVTLSSENSLPVKHGYFTNGVFTVTDKPKLPWCVVLANSVFGTLVSDKSLGFTWALNSRENKLTPWSNDTMTDNTGEKLYLRINGTVYDLVVSATVKFSRKIVQYLGTVEGIDYNITVWVPEKGMIKHIDVNFENQQKEEKEVEVVYYTEPIMGISKRDTRLLKSKADKNSVTVSNHCTLGPYGYMRVGLLSSADFFTCDRAEFLNGKWDGATNLPNNDSCVAIGKKIKLPPKREESARFILSWGESETASKVVTKINLGIRNEEDAIYISTPDRELNYMFNTWLPAQIINSRILGRTGFFQNGGAYGFRDQLQDVSSLVLTNPMLVRTHIIRCCAHQFEQGDVLHWWHTMPASVGGTKGVRTRYSDDLLWLPLVASEYAQKTGDFAIFDIEVPYVGGEELSENEHEKYFELKKSNQKGTIYEHCYRAIERAMKFGDHGLSLIGGGDWNDGFNSVGKKGKGESVWLSQFFAMVMTKFSKICELRSDTERQNRYLEESERLKKAVDEMAWNGEWYLRAFFDDGTPMGAKGSPSCEIDSLTQSFAVLCDMPDEERKSKALASAVEKLVDVEHGIIKLFSPPFTSKGKQAGYVNAYPPGIRENGGQYTHAAVWLCNALIKNGQQDLGYKLLRMINPAHKYTDPKSAENYKTEAFALCGDVYSRAGVEGRGGWSLYTGAAGWYYRTVYEDLLGIVQFHNKLLFSPKLPSNWNEYYAKIIKNGGAIDIHVKRGDRNELTVDGQHAEFVPLDGKNHSVVLIFN